jgi:hypothetical protein
MNFFRLKIFLLALLFLLFCPFLIKAQSSYIDITVSAFVRSTSTPPATFCGDGDCTDDENCTICPQDCGTCGGVFVSPDTRVIFQGKAYPFANIVIQKNGVVISSFKAESSGIFEKIINGVAGGTYNFSTYAEDKKGVISEALGFTLTVLQDKITTVSGIFIPPTISLFPSTAERGEKISIFGQSFPESEINLYFLPQTELKKINSDINGNWLYSLDTSGLNKGDYTVKAMAIYKDGQSSFSKIMPFSILKSVCRGSDLNFDQNVDLVDFSILLYFWGQNQPANRCADINGDGIVNIIDFSIMMYWWSG